MKPEKECPPQPANYESPRNESELRNYFKETTVHGFRYLVDGRSIGERIAWFAVIFSGFVYAGILIYSNVNDWEKNPG